MTQQAQAEALALADACNHDWHAVRPHLVVQMLRDQYARIAQLEAQQAVQLPDLASVVVNDAAWKFIEAMPHQLPGPIFNDLKPALYAAISYYHAHAIAAAPTPPAQERKPLTDEQMHSLILDDLFPHGITKGDLSLITAVIRHAERANGIGATNAD